nr:hypothetical protein [Tanacetum cinerariifolium]
MENEIDDGLFWLPTEFLNDDDDVEFKSVKQPKFGVFGSGLSSPVESVVGSTENESDEDDYLNEMTRKLAQSTLDDGYAFLEGRVDLPLPGGRGLASSPNRSSLPTSGRRLQLNQPARKLLGSQREPELVRETVSRLIVVWCRRV